uniref:Tripartite motif containing 35-28 n=1 Tax=Periophthalmus magnuspinnatus TaxID=409849 RepID=A0A3B3ZW40_9GOBI
ILKKMATVSEYDLSCRICYRVFRGPVLLSCSHSFCRECLKTWWEEKPFRPCPICNRRSSREDPPQNLALKNLCLDFEKSSIVVCSKHSEKLKLYCFNHQQPVCLVCRDFFQNQSNVNNKTALVRMRKKALEKSKFQFSAAVSHVEAQAQLTERQIQDKFKKLHQAVREEEQQKRKSLEDKMAAVSRETEALAETIAATEKHMGAEDVSFLLQYKAALERMQRCPLVEGPKMGPGALIDQAKHLGNLGFTIWRNMKDLVQFYPIVLDPNTAHPDLTLSEDLTSVASGERQKVPENLERFQWCRVLGSEGFGSGIYIWDVEVCGDDYWSVGVVSESVHRKGPMNTGVWEICLLDGQCHAISQPRWDKMLSLKNNLQRVRVKLDFDRERLIFSDADTNTHLYTFTHSFSERLFPFCGLSRMLSSKTKLHRMQWE